MQIRTILSEEAIDYADVSKPMNLEEFRKIMDAYIAGGKCVLDMFDGYAIKHKNNHEHVHYFFKDKKIAEDYLEYIDHQKLFYYIEKI
jgi:GTP-sensing pleiotropic transcriptional regulator CodY